MEQSWGWPGDTEGRTILALVLDAQLTGRAPKYLDEILRRMPSKMNERDYFGPIWTDAVNEQQLSGMGWVLRYLVYKGVREQIRVPRHAREGSGVILAKCKRNSHFRLHSGCRCDTLYDARRTSLARVCKVLPEV